MDTAKYQSEKEAYKKQLMEVVKNKPILRFDTFEKLTTYIDKKIKQQKEDMDGLDNLEALLIFNVYLTGLEGIYQRINLKQDIVSLNKSLGMLEEIYFEYIVAFKKKYNLLDE